MKRNVTLSFMILMCQVSLGADRSRGMGSKAESPFERAGQRRLAEKGVARQAGAGAEPPSSSDLRPRGQGPAHTLHMMRTVCKLRLFISAGKGAGSLFLLHSLSDLVIPFTLEATGDGHCGAASLSLHPFFGRKKLV